MIDDDQSARSKTTSNIVNDADLLKKEPKNHKSETTKDDRGSSCMPTFMVSSQSLKYSRSNILSYDPSWLISYGWLLPTRASLLHSPLLVFKVIGIITITTTLAVLKCPAEREDLTFAGTRSCVALPSDWSSMTLLTIASFMMALFTRSVLDRWWQTRKHVSSTGGRCKNIAMFLASWTATASPAVIEQREHAIRLLNFAHALVFHTANPDMDSAEERLQPLIDANVCTKEERAAVAGMPEPYIIVIGWVSCILNDLAYSHRAINSSQLEVLHNLLIDMRNNAGDGLLFVNTQLPYAAIQLITMIVFAFEVQLLALCSGVIGSGLQDHNYDQVFMGYFTMILATEIYLGLLSLYAALSNPFGADPLDFPSVAYQESLLKTTTALSKVITGGATSGILNVSQEPLSYGLVWGGGRLPQRRYPVIRSREGLGCEK